MPTTRIIPLTVATALFMENMDSTVIATSLPAIAADIGTSPLALKLAITSYLLSLAIFIPASGWVADRFGARTVFSVAVGVFVVGSLMCAMAESLSGFVIARMVQGMGGAMMTPVGRIMVVRMMSRRELVAAMAWVTTPALIGPLVGPPIGGFITTYASWHWIFLINVPIGLLGIALALRFFENVRAETPERFDLPGMVLSGLGIGGLAFGLSVAGLNFLPWPVTSALIAGGAFFLAAYVLHARRTDNPALDFTLMRLPTFRASIVGGFLFRMGIGALPFLLPLMLQLGFGMSPFQSGLTTFAAAIGAISMKLGVTHVLRHLGFRTVLVGNAVVAAIFLGVIATFTAATPWAIMFTILIIGGFFRSLQFTSINAIAYAEVSEAKVSRATTLAAVAQQLAISAGVAVGALAVEISLHLRGGNDISAADFPTAFILVATISAASALIFMRLPKDAGAELADRLPPPEPNDQRGG